MSQARTYRLTVTLTEAELTAFIAVLNCPFVGDDDDIIGVIGATHHNQVKSAKRMHEKITDAVVCAKRLAKESSRVSSNER